MDPAARTALIAAFGSVPPPPPPRQRRIHAQKLSDFADIGLAEWKVSEAPVPPKRHNVASAALPAWLLKQRDDLLCEATSLTQDNIVNNRPATGANRICEQPRSAHSELSRIEYVAVMDDATVTDSSEVRTWTILTPADFFMVNFRRLLHIFLPSFSPHLLQVQHPWQTQQTPGCTGLQSSPCITSARTSQRKNRRQQTDNVWLVNLSIDGPPPVRLNVA